MNEHVKRWASIGCAIGAVSLYAAASNASGEATGGGATGDGAAGSFVGSRQAQRWTAAYARQNPGTVQAHYFGRDLLDELLPKPGAAAISIQRAIDDRGQATVVLVPIDQNGRAA